MPSPHVEESALVESTVVCCPSVSDGAPVLEDVASSDAEVVMVPAKVLVDVSLVLVADVLVVPVVALGMSAPGEKQPASKRQAAGEYFFICARSAILRQIRPGKARPNGNWSYTRRRTAI